MRIRAALSEAAFLLVPILMIVGVLHPASVAAQPTISHAGIEIWGCIPPGKLCGSVPFSGIGALVDASPGQILATFPEEWHEKPRIRVGMGLRPPGLRFSFAAPTDVSGLSLVYPPPGLVFSPPEVASPDPPIQVTSILVDWDPLEGLTSFGGTLYDASCSFFIHVQQEVMVTAEATINLVGIYAAPGDTVRVWGTEVGILDVHLEDARLTGPIAVEPTSWGEVKSSFR
jgi:hypothetical protein